MEKQALRGGGMNQDDVEMNLLSIIIFSCGYVIGYLALEIVNVGI